MSDQPTKSEAPDRRALKAEAAAAKARAKASRPWYRKKRFIIPAVLFVLIVAAAIAGSDEADEPAAVVDPEPEEAAADDADPADVPEEADVEEVATVGQEASDGQFTFTVHGIECGASTVGEDPFVTEAQGQWCALHLTVENTGDQARALSAGDQYLYDTRERRFSAATLIGIETPLYEQINPGNSIDGTVYFDVPLDLEPASVELHDSPFSGGVLILLE